MIGQVTPIAIDKIGYRFYIVFVVCNFTNALFFCKSFPSWNSRYPHELTWKSGAIQPETKKRPLEEMNYLFTNAPFFIPTMNMRDFELHDLEHRIAEAERKESEMRHVE